MDDKKTISNQFRETDYVAKKFGIAVWEVYKVKADLKTNDRATIYKAIENLLNYR